MLDKILEESNCDIDLEVIWPVNAKNSLTNINGFSPYQLPTGINSKLSFNNNAKVPALTSTPINKVICKNLQAIQKAREAFTVTENYEKLRGAHSRNIRTSGVIEYLSEESVYFKHLDS